MTERGEPTRTEEPPASTDHRAHGCAGCITPAQWADFIGYANELATWWPESDHGEVGRHVLELLGREPQPFNADAFLRMVNLPPTDEAPASR